MAMLIKEAGGDTLIGAIDGINTLYTVTFEFEAVTVAVYVNSILVNPADPDGYSISGAQSITMKVALNPGDTIQVEYESELVAGGGADGGCPTAPELEDYAPDTESGQYLTVTSTEEEVPVTDTEGLPVPTTLTDELVPVILSAE